MSRVQVIDIDVADATTTGIATGLTGAGPFTTFTASGPTDGLAHQLSLDSAANLSGITMTIVGTGPDGEAQTEALAGPNTAPVETTGYFKTITSITASATLGANTMDVGWVDEVSSRTIPLDRHRDSAPTVQVDVTGTINYTVQQTTTPFNQSGNTWSKAWIACASPLASATADQIGATSAHVTGLRVIVNSYSSGAELQAYISEQGA